jgi:hypothetical protein
VKREDIAWAAATVIAAALCVAFLPVALPLRLLSCLADKHHKL